MLLSSKIINTVYEYYTKHWCSAKHEDSYEASLTRFSPDSCQIPRHFQVFEIETTVHPLCNLSDYCSQLFHIRASLHNKTRLSHPSGHRPKLLTSF